jgi:ferredoxin
MAKVKVKNTGEEIEVPDGSQLDTLEAQSSILFACKSGTCGSCMVKVNKGMENLEEPGENEKYGLQAFANYPNQRLMCQCKLKKGEIEVEY